MARPAPTRTPVVGIALRPQARLADGTTPRLVQNRAYLEAIVAAGGVPLLIPPVATEAGLRALHVRCDALLLPGGPDVEPALYGEDPRPDCNVRSAPELDATEILLTTWALDEERPILAICRGMQLLNVVLGGTLWQDIEVQGGGDAGHDSHSRDALVHDLDVVPGSILAGVLGAERLRVNSIHHQAVRDLGVGLVGSAHSPDGLVEGAELADRPVIALQCHPEELTAGHAWAQRPFEWLVAAAG